MSTSVYPILLLSALLSFALVHHMEIHRGLINVSRIIHVTTKTFLIEGTIISTLSVRKEVMEWEPIHSNPGLSVVVIIIDIIIVM